MLFGDAAYRDAADRLYGFLKNKLAGPGGGFYASMGMAEGQPGVDKRQYARETGQAIQGLAAYYDATANKEALAFATAAADWALRERSLPGGGFRHRRHLRGSQDGRVLCLGFARRQAPAPFT